MSRPGRHGTAIRMPSTWAAVALVVLVVAVLALVEWTQYGHAEDQIRLQGQALAQDYALRIGGRLNNQLAELEFIAGMVAPDPTQLNQNTARRAEDVLEHLAARHSGVETVRVVGLGISPTDSASFDGEPRVLAPRGYTPVTRIPDVFLGGVVRQPRSGFEALNLRYVVRGVDGQPLYALETPYRLSSLFAYDGGLVVADLWRFDIIDTRTRTVIGDWNRGKLQITVDSGDADEPISQDAFAGASVTGFPLRVVSGWTPAAVWALWWRTAPARWGVEALLLALLAVLVLTLGRQRARVKVWEEELRRRALCDPLTGLPNREGFNLEITRWAKTAGDQARMAVMVIDLYQFGEFNRRFGEAAGDKVLCDVTARLKALPAPLVVARIGADGFALAYPGLTPEHLGERIVAALGVMSGAFTLPDGASRKITASLGCAVYPEDAGQPASLLAQAEAALFTRLERQTAEESDEVAPFGDQARANLNWVARFSDRRLSRAADAIFEGLCADPDNKALIDLLGKSDRQRMRAQVERLLYQLLDPDMTDADYLRHSMRQGQLLAAVGVSPQAIVRVAGHYMQSVSERIRRVPGRRTQQEILRSIVVHRLERWLAQVSEAAQILRTELLDRQRELHQNLQGVRSSALLMDTMVEAAGSLHYVAVAAGFSLDAHGGLMLEAQTSGSEPGTPQLLKSEGASTARDLLRKCWGSGEVETLARIETRQGVWARAARHRGWRSMAAVPMVDAAGRLHGVILLFGRLVRQFDAPAMREALDGLRREATQALAAMRDGGAAHIALEQRIAWRERLFNGGLRMDMQPIVDLRSGQCVKVEALARLVLDDGEVLAPGRFLSILGEQELHRLFIAGLHQACEALAKWERHGLTLDLSFNLPPSTLAHPDCTRWITGVLRDHRIAPQCVTFELLEDADFTDADAYERAVMSLHELGVKLAMDDLGSGYSSLQRLRTLPFDIVKIDQGLVRSAEDKPRQTIALVGALTRMAHGLGGIEVAVEGIESDDLIEVAQVLGADLVQGYGVQRPILAEEIPQWVAALQWPVFDPAHPRCALAVAAHDWLLEQGIMPGRGRAAAVAME